MLTKIRERSQSESGFTLVELLVVMLILGILAAIAIPAFFNQRQKAQDSDAKASVRTAQTAMETYATDNNGDYTGAVEADLIAIEETLNDAPNPVDVVGAPSDETYTVAVESDSGTTFSLTRTNTGDITYTCDAPNDGGCPASGDWGGDT
jgi:type IV pilus assembly protein PilA